jgi:hypothetical protein
LRGGRIIVEVGIVNITDVDLPELAMRGSMSVSAAGHCRDAFLGVTQALREARLLATRQAPKRAPVAPRRAASTQEPIDAPEPATEVAAAEYPAPNPNKVNRPRGAGSCLVGNVL